MPRFLTTAIVCGAAPLLIGSLVYLVWRFTWWEWLFGAGMLTIGVGLISFLVGTNALVSHLMYEYGTELVPSKPTHRRLRALGAGALLLVNFPAAGYLVYSVGEVLSRYTVDVVNESGSPIDSFVLTGPGLNCDAGPISADRRVRWQLHFRGKGELKFSARTRGVALEGVVDGYVCHGLGGHAVVRVQPKGIYAVELKPRGGSAPRD